MCFCLVFVGAVTRVNRTPLVTHTHTHSIKHTYCIHSVILNMNVFLCVSGLLVTWTGPVLRFCSCLDLTGRFWCVRKTPENSPSVSSTLNTHHTHTDSCQSNCFVSHMSICLRFNMDTRHIKVTYSEGLYRINEKKAFKGLIVSLSATKVETVHINIFK